MKMPEIVAKLKYFNDFGIDYKDLQKIIDTLDKYKISPTLEAICDAVDSQLLQISPLPGSLGHVTRIVELVNQLRATEGLKIRPVYEALAHNGTVASYHFDETNANLSHSSLVKSPPKECKAILLKDQWYLLKAVDPDGVVAKDRAERRKLVIARLSEEERDLLGIK